MSEPFLDELDVLLRDLETELSPSENKDVPEAVSESVLTEQPTADFEEDLTGELAVRPEETALREVPTPEDLLLPLPDAKPVKQKKKGSKVGKVISNLVFFAVIVAMLGGSIMFAASRNAEKTLFGYRFFNVLTKSMEPELHKGALVFVKATPPEEIQVGDIITFFPGESSSKYLTHRVIEKHEDYKGTGKIGFQTQGDANKTADGFVVNGEKVVGVVKSDVPVAGYIVAYVQQHVMLIIIFVGLLTLFALLLRALFSVKAEK